MKWIPVEKRLPKIGVPVWCWYAINSEYFCVGRVASIVVSRTVDGKFKHIEWLEGMYGYDSIKPTHWMPIMRNGLPEIDKDNKT